MGNELAKTQQRGISAYLNNPEVKQNVVSVVGDKESQKFISSIVSAVQTNPALAECSNKSILSVALLGHSLNLPQSPQLGIFYFVPYNNTKKIKDPNTGRTETITVKEATFQLSWKGYIQLAMRSGQYKQINATEVREGELISYNPITEEIDLRAITDFNDRMNRPVIGYYAFFTLTNGFRKELYWSREQMESHASRYSKAYKSDKKYGSSRSFWSTDFDAMAKKTMIRQLISKWGIMSVDMQTAYESDMALIDDNGNPDYVDNKPEVETATDVYLEEQPVETEPVEGEILDDDGNPLFA